MSEKSPNPPCACRGDSLCIWHLGVEVRAGRIKLEPTMPSPAASREEIGERTYEEWQRVNQYGGPPNVSPMNFQALISSAFRLAEVERENDILRAGIAHAEASHRLTADTADERIEQLKKKVEEGMRGMGAAKMARELAEDDADILAARVEAAIAKALEHGDSWMDHRVRESIRDIRCALQGQHAHGMSQEVPRG